MKEGDHFSVAEIFASNSGNVFCINNLTSYYRNFNFQFNSHLYELDIETLMEYIVNELSISNYLFHFKNNYCSFTIYKLSKMGDIVDCDPGFYLSVYSQDNYVQFSIHDHIFSLYNFLTANINNIHCNQFKTELSLKLDQFWYWPI